MGGGDNPMPGPVQGGRSGSSGAYTYILRGRFCSL